MRWIEPVASQRRAWQDWVKSRPACIRDAIKKHKLDPWTMYKLKTTGQVVSLRSISEPAPTTNEIVNKVTVSVNVEPKMQGLPGQRFGVFGIDPADLIEYEPDERSKRT